jgi:hypothetical protein
MQPFVQKPQRQAEKGKRQKVEGVGCEVLQVCTRCLIGQYNIVCYSLRFRF